MGRSFQQHIPSFEEKLKRVNAAEVSASPYCRRYLTHILEHHRYFLKIYAQLLDIASENCPKDPAHIVFLDYGAGNGLLGLFAKHCGFGKVYLNDIDPVFTAGIQTLASQIEISIDGCMTGDMDVVCREMQSDKPDLVCGTDLIEHIYDLDSFFRQLKALNPAMVTVFSTAANIDNPIKRKKIIELQQRDEMIGSDPADSILAGENPHPPFLHMRRSIIQSAAPELNQSNIEKLSVLTRGLNEKDIRSAINKLLHEGIPPRPIDHPSNTCNPETGSWTERLLTKEEYASIYTKAGFQLTIYNGFYDTYKKPFPQMIINPILNICIRFLGRRLAPFVVLVGNSTVFNEI